MPQNAPPNAPSRHARALFNLLKKNPAIESAPAIPKSEITAFAKIIETEIHGFSPEDLSGIFVDGALFASCCEALVARFKDYERAHDEAHFFEFAARAFQRELVSISYLAPLCENASSASFKRLATNAKVILDSLAIETRKLGATESYHRFLKKTFELIQTLTRSESLRLHTRISNATTNPEDTWLEHSIYRAFDRLDEIMGIDYTRDKGMWTDPQNHERLYEGAGLGVQTSYASLLILLDELKPEAGARFIDLGSGYGRVGLAVGIVRPDIDFIGYEYVPHRVEASQNSALQAGLSGHVSFITQDLAERSFQIPEADFYYMYDPFSQETYQHVFDQLMAIAQKSRVAIVTKGNAGAWIENALKGAGWTADRTGDTGTLGIFRSPHTIRK
jgi:predicted RNA methylase